MVLVGPTKRLRAVDPAAADAPRSESALIGRVAEGDQQAFAELYDLVVGRVHAVVLAVLRDAAQAEEVTQEVMVEIWRQAPRYDPRRGSVRTWAATMAHRRAVDRVRSSQSARDRDQADVDSRVAESPRTDEVAEAVETIEESEMLGAALEQLSETQRESIRLAYFGGHTYREVAEMLGTPEGTVKTRIRDGLTRLRSVLEVDHDR